MKTIKFNFIFISALFILGAQNVMASASAIVDEEQTASAGFTGQTIRISMVYNSKEPQPDTGTLIGFAITLPGGTTKRVSTNTQTPRLSIDEAFDVSGLTSFPISITYHSRFIGNDSREIPWQGNHDIKCTSKKSFDISRLEALRILWDAEGKCSLEYKYKTPTVKAATKT